MGIVDKIRTTGSQRQVVQFWQRPWLAVRVAAVLSIFTSPWHRQRITWEERTSAETMPPPDWPWCVWAFSTGHRTVPGLAVLGPVRNRRNTSWGASQSAAVPLWLPCQSPGSCPQLLPWLPSNNRLWRGRARWNKPFSPQIARSIVLDHSNRNLPKAKVGGLAATGHSWNQQSASRKGLWSQQVHAEKYFGERIIISWLKWQAFTYTLKRRKFNNL